MHNPNYYKNRINIKFIKDFNNYQLLIEIEDKKYEISNSVINNIEKLIVENFDNLINISKNQSMSTNLVESNNNWTIKYGTIMLKINYEELIESDKNYLNILYNNILNIIKIDNGGI